MFVDQVDLNVGDVCPFPKEVVSDKPVEIERRRGADVDLVVGDLRNRAEDASDLTGGGVGLLEGIALGGVDNHLDFRFVVEGEHLHGHELGRHRCHGKEEERHGADRFLLGLLVWCGPEVLELGLGMAAEELEGEPR